MCIIAAPPGSSAAWILQINSFKSVEQIRGYTKAGADQYYLMCLDTDISSPRLMRAWKRRSWIEYCFRTLKHLLATGACQMHSEDAYYGQTTSRFP